MPGTPNTRRRTLALHAQNALELHNVNVKHVSYRGRRALRLTEATATPTDSHALAFVNAVEFQNGEIEVWLAGAPVVGAFEGARGYVGIAFRVGPGGEQFECFYLRPTNGRADDQLRRNHATQYVSHPDFPWYKLRSENPGVYESYTDIVAKEWTRMRIVVANTRAQLYINNAPQPCLIVNDLKLGETSGKIALWIGGGTIAYFADLTIR